MQHIFVCVLLHFLGFADHHRHVCGVAVRPNGNWIHMGGLQDAEEAAEIGMIPIHITADLDDIDDVPPPPVALVGLCSLLLSDSFT